jgi:acetyltransferase-like isoleucine patch superfamily enzyme
MHKEHEGSPTRTKFDDRDVPFRKVFAWAYKLLHYCYWKNVYSGYRKKHGIPDEFRLNGDDIRINGDGKLIIKGIGVMCHNTIIELAKGSELHIGKSVWMSKNIVIYTKPYTLGNTEGIVHPQDAVTGKVIIEDDVFIMPFVFIQGSREGTVIKKGTVVPPFSIIK